MISYPKQSGLKRCEWRAQAVPFVNCAPFNLHESPFPHGELDVSSCQDVVAGGTCCVTCKTTGETTTFQCPHRNTDPNRQLEVRPHAVFLYILQSNTKQPSETAVFLQGELPECKTQCEVDHDYLESHPELAGLKATHTGFDTAECEAKGVLEMLSGHNLGKLLVRVFVGVLLWPPLHEV